MQIKMETTVTVKEKVGSYYKVVEMRQGWSRGHADNGILEFGCDNVGMGAKNLAS